MRKAKKYLILTLPLLFSGCSLSLQSAKNLFNSSNNTNNISIEKEYEPQDNEIAKALLSQYSEWKGVKYRYGGNSKNGIDCSAFIQRTFQTKLNVKIPRTTYYQSRVGKKVSKKEAKVGDLVFFKTGKNSRHVGIYLDDGRFIHVSRKKGVIISTLDNVYFKKHFWKIQRVLED
ncbi:glycoside hydrolase [Malaciobacter canalis]|uniref:Glycoside hydrolase n=1 Tax=Malaciobacter canalis TaxID=1912871 RepID=A0ABX4LMF4_9BACT|nr:NlpC/P60 family protein [Malaciobacter canalis]PHO08695.1 glycoside hydrolase [Malaciobacter canalis]QEE31859.1 outer membrane lipoprotein, NlpC/P60 family [Malaciobacter canalis]